MSEVKIEIGENLAATIHNFVVEINKKASKNGESIGAEVQRAFGIDVTKIAKDKILIDAALEQGLEIKIEN